MSVTHKNVRMGELEPKQCVAVNEAVTLLGDKWTLLVLGTLSRHDALRYNAIERELEGISQRMLTLTLKTLVANGLVERTVFPTVPPRVDYALTSMGRTLVVPMRGLLAWSLEHHDAMAQARAAYARRTDRGA